MEIKTKYNIGDVVYGPYPRDEHRVRLACPACGGQHFIKQNGYTYTCNNCYDGYKHLKLHVTTPHKYKVIKILVDVSDDSGKQEIYYHVKGHDSVDGYKAKEKELFSDKKDCTDYCKEENKGYDMYISAGWEDEDKFNRPI